MSKIESYISNLDITNKVTDEEVSEAESLLRLYAPTLRRAGWHLDEMRDACYESRRQSIHNCCQSVTLFVKILRTIKCNLSTQEKEGNCHDYLYRSRQQSD